MVFLVAYYRMAQSQLNNMAIISFDEFLKKAGGTAKEVQTTPAPISTKPSFIAEMENKAMQAGQETAQKFRAGEINIGQVALRGAADAVSAGFEGLVKIATAITPEFIEEPAKAAIIKAFQRSPLIPIIKQGAEAYQKRKEEDPAFKNAAESFEDALTILGVFPLAKG